MVRISESFNKIIFIEELCGVRVGPWQKERMEQWLKESGGRLSEKEQELATQLANIAPKVNLNLVEAYFLTLEDAELWNTLGQEIGVAETAALKEIFDGFSQRFTVVWSKERLSLEKIQSYLDSQSEKMRSVSLIIGTLAALENEKRIYEQTPLHLAISSREQDDVVGWFSAMNNKTDLVLECSGAPANNYIFLEAVLLHEFFHTALRENLSIKILIEKVARENQDILSPLSPEMPPRQIVEELLISSFVPEGYIALKYFGKKIEAPHSIDKTDEVSFVSVRQLCASALQKSAQEYIDSEKAIDETYLTLLIDAIKNG